ncbi:MAG: hypothetical protein RTV41_09825 [Candidatus Thorarchaeota archaeon]
MKRRRLALIASLIIILLTSLIGFSIYSSFVLDPRNGEQGWVEETGGLSYVSEIYGPEGNTSYTVRLQDVNFTFLYWTYPSGDNYTVMDAAYTAYFLIEFLEDTNEVITLATGSWWTTSGSLIRPLSVVTTEHENPEAGVLYGAYLDNPVGWQFVVSID